MASRSGTREVQADFHGTVADLLSKAVQTDRLDSAVTKEDSQILLEALRSWGGLDRDYRYPHGGRQQRTARLGTSHPAAACTACPHPPAPWRPRTCLRGRLWRALSVAADVDYQTTLFQPVGGMDAIARAMTKEITGILRLRAKVTAIQQNGTGVSVTWHDTATGEAQQSHADYCVCTIPLSVLSQIDINVAPAMADAIEAVPYAAVVKIGLQFRRRFWEEDDAIYGGISYTDLPISLIGYPSSGYLSGGKGVLLGAYSYGAWAYEFTALDPAERIRRAVAYGAQIHPQYAAEFDNGMAVGWHRVPWTLGCYGQWTEATRKQHYTNLCAIDGRIVLARRTRLLPPCLAGGRGAIRPGRGATPACQGVGDMRWLCTTALLLMAPAALADTPGPTFANRFIFTEQGGAAIYAAVCAACHMPNGQGAVGGRYLPGAGP